MWRLLGGNAFICFFMGIINLMLTGYLASKHVYAVSFTVKIGYIRIFD